MAHTRTPHRRRRRSCTLRRPGDGRCSGPAEVEVTDAYGSPLRGCIRHAAATLRLLDRSYISAAARKTAITETHAAAGSGDRP